MIEVFVIALALSMDAFAVSVGLGTNNFKDNLSLGLTAGLYFGLFHGGMALIGYGAGVVIYKWIEVFAPWVAFILLAFIGGKMIYESQQTSSHNERIKVSHKMLLILAIATSIDAVVTGFSLTLFAFNSVTASIIIGIIAGVLSWLGVYVGTKFGAYFKDKAVLIGGVMLILTGLKILLT